MQLFFRKHKYKPNEFVYDSGLLRRNWILTVDRAIKMMLIIITHIFSSKI